MKKLTALVSIFAIFSVSIIQAATTIGGYPASTSLENFKKAGSLIIQNDDDALAEMIALGLVVITKSGLEVEIVKYNMFTGIAKVRVKGQLLEFWTNIEAIKR